MCFFTITFNDRGLAQLAFVGPDSYREVYKFKLIKTFAPLKRKLRKPFVNGGREICLENFDHLFDITFLQQGKDFRNQLA